MIKTWQDAVQYMSRACVYGGYEQQDMPGKLPRILEAYKEVEKLTEPEEKVVNVTIAMIYGKGM